MAACPAAAAAADSKVTPVQKALVPLLGIVEKGKKSKADKEVQCSAYKLWCGDTIAEETDDIATTEMKIKELRADFGKLPSDIGNLANGARDGPRGQRGHVQGLQRMARIAVLALGFFALASASGDKVTPMQRSYS